MAATMVVCPECGNAVSAGRLACNGCGALLASVVGGGRVRAVAAVVPPADVAIDPPIGDPIGDPDQPSDGAYLAPSATHRPPAAALVNPPSGPPAPAEPDSGAPAAPARQPVGRIEGVADEAATWLVMGGSLVGILSFVLPWATDGVIGASGVGYFATWGLANPGHLLLALGLIALLAVQLLTDRIPGWIRGGVLPLLAGGILLGLVFAYVARPFGGGTGVTFLAVASVALAAGGVLGVRPSRR